MKSRFITIACIIMAASFNVYAQDMQGGKPYIEVNASSEKEVVPDEIYISIQLVERYSGRNKITIDEQETQLKESVRQLGIDIFNLSLSNADASYVKVNWLNKDVMAKKNYMLKVNSAEMVGRVFNELGKLDIKNATVARVDYSKREELKKELRISAVKKAKDQAEYMLQAIGQTAGKPLYVHENAGLYYPVTNMMANRANVMNKEGGNETIGQSDDYIEFKKIKFTSNVDARFEIK